MPPIILQPCLFFKLSYGYYCWANLYDFATVEKSLFITHFSTVANNFKVLNFYKVVVSY